MFTRHTGHFVQVFKPLGPKFYNFTMPKPRTNEHPRRHPNYVEVEGRTISRTVSEYPYWAEDGWFYMSRELPRKRAVKFAKAYKRAGFSSRVVFQGNSGEPRITDEFMV